MKTSSHPEPGTPQPALIFIPDISGFTRFVTDTEINHARHIISELLEILIDSNKVGLEVSEVEGDAILFYRFGKAPTASDMTQQVKEMFSRFHMHLRNYERQRICNCGACSTASNLAIKFVAHYVDVTINKIHQYKKLFGKEVIVAHRLLKNDIDSHEYSLFTDNLRSACDTWKNMDEQTWSPVHYSGHEYDSGKVNYCYVSLIPLLDQLPDPAAEDFTIKGRTTKVMDSEEIIDAPIELVLDVMADVAWRSKWIPGTLETVTDVNSSLTQTGQTHKCMAKGPVLVSHDYTVTDHFISFTETDANKSHCCVYALKKLDDNRTHLQTSMFLKKNIVMEIMFKLMMKSKVEKVYKQANDNLKKYCESLVAQGKEHSYSIKISPAPAIHTG